ncbi:chitin synthase export chaperone [Cladophialophora bantiana CBS 173.52]|uniref:Chitin synthase export chaperone n=1 Tax=Cladophialophora bantiana (strain ATCC 10958 / CBS 173.52 / CDC B-1940 / NIH 8579) TaxID=1442370 RepID=A0A0D2HXF2_CLAB1|nr:chitin synthase export chaperone [Cladophialophora bantiana CBS 173.52]KIW98058.1 chitin synthase export chaperone [Cladophialophora bantiana CBS 173.52]
MGFGSFESICKQSALPLCYILGPPADFTTAKNPVLLPGCSARSIELANTIIFQAATDFAHIAALFMTAIMIFHVRSKFTAVGRKEILTFFYIYSLLTIISLVLDAGVIQATSGSAYPWFVAVQNGLATALCTSLLINGFVGFQLYEDGTTLSIWLLRLGSLIMFVISFAVSLLTFKSWAGLSPTSTTGLFIVLYIINAIFLAVYFVMQIILVVNTLQDRWPLGDLAFGAFFFIIGQVILYVFGKRICEGVSHYLDGLFFATVCNLLGVMMVYKYWDSITREDLEFSVGTKQGHWDVKEAFLDPSGEDYRTSLYGGGNAPTGRESVYDASSMSLDYAPQVPAHFHQHPSIGHQYGNQQSHGLSHQYSSSRDRLSAYGHLVEGRQSYGDIRRQLPNYEDYSDPQMQRSGLRSRDGTRERERDYAY